VEILITANSLPEGTQFNRRNELSTDCAKLAALAWAAVGRNRAAWVHEIAGPLSAFALVEVAGNGHSSTVLACCGDGCTASALGNVKFARRFC